MDFLAIDVETASPDPASICQIGIVNFRAGEVVGHWSRLFNPGCDFHPRNVAVHRIEPAMVADEPPLSVVLPSVSKLLNRRVVAAHTGFDRAAIDRALHAHGVGGLDCRWLDTSRVARRTWPEVAQTGYGLRNVCRLFGHSFDHHDAMADAEACGRVLVEASRITGHQLDDWFRIVETRIGGGRTQREKPEANPDGHMFGRTIVFTGQFAFTREDMARMACEAGFNVATAPSKKSDYVVVGDGYQAGADLGERRVTGKHRRARELMAEGWPLRIIDEGAFLSVIRAKDEV